MKYIMITVSALFLVSCSSTPLEQRRSNIKECIHDFIDKEVDPYAASKICGEIYYKGAGFSKSKIKVEQQLNTD